MKGRKRHVLVDTQGHVIRVAVLAADLSDAVGAVDVCRVAQPACPRLARIWADSAYQGALVEWVNERYGWTLEIVRRPKEQQGFAVQPRRWVVERTFAWLGRNRRLSKDYEEFAETTEAWIYLAASRLLLRQLVQ